MRKKPWKYSKLISKVEIDERQVDVDVIQRQITTI